MSKREYNDNRIARGLTWCEQKCHPTKAALLISRACHYVPNIKEQITKANLSQDFIEQVNESFDEKMLDHIASVPKLSQDLVEISKQFSSLEKSFKTVNSKALRELEIKFDNIASEIGKPYRHKIFKHNGIHHFVCNFDLENSSCILHYGKNSPSFKDHSRFMEGNALRIEIKHREPTHDGKHFTKLAISGINSFYSGSGVMELSIVDSFIAEYEKLTSGKVVSVYIDMYPRFYDPTAHSPSAVATHLQIKDFYKLIGGNLCHTTKSTINGSGFITYLVANCIAMFRENNPQSNNIIKI